MCVRGFAWKFYSGHIVYNHYTGLVGWTYDVQMKDKTTILSLLFLFAVAVALYVFAFKIELVKSTPADLWSLLGCLILAWVVGFAFYRLNIFGTRNTTKRDFAEFVGWAKRQPGTEYSGVAAQLIKRAAVAVLIGGAIVVALLYWVTH
jgi:hypothetical protein